MSAPTWSAQWHAAEPGAHAGYLDDLTALSARMLGWRDEIGLVPLAARWGWFGPGCMAGEAARGWPDLVPRVAARGWEQFAHRATPAAYDVVTALRRDPTPLHRISESGPPTGSRGCATRGVMFVWRPQTELLNLRR